MPKYVALGYRQVLAGIVLWVSATPLNLTLGAEPSSDEIMRLIEQLDNRDANLVSAAINRLENVRSEESVSAILNSLGTVSDPVRWKLCEVLGAVGEPAVEPVFTGSVTEPGARTARIPWASHVLTSYLHTTALPLLEKKLRSGQPEERKVAAWAFSSITRYHGIGESDPAETVSLLLEASIHDPLTYVNTYAADAIGNIKDDASIPALTKLVTDDLLSDRACSALAQRGAKASIAVPILKSGIQEGRLTAAALDALVAIQGKEAVPFVVENISNPKDGLNVHHRISVALLRHPDPIAIPIMQKELWGEDGTSRVRAALFFAALDHPTSVEQLRKCLSIFPEGKTELTHPLNTEVSCARDLRGIAARYLGEYGDTESYEAILKMLKTDPSIKARTAAAESLGKARYEKAVVPLQACFDVSDAGRSAMGHRDGTLHAAAVEALANIASPEAYRVLYNGLTEGLAKKPCARFWQNAEERTVFERFVEHFEKAPLDDETAAGIIAAQLRRHNEAYAIPETEFAAVKDQFLLSVRDAEHFDDRADLSHGGQLNVTINYRLYKNGFAKLHFTFYSTNSTRLVHGYSMVYRKQGDAWLPVAKVNHYTT